MGSTVLISVDEYLSTTYRPDCDYVDGEVLERNVGERPHGRLQLILGMIFEVNRRKWKIVAMGDQRVQINSTRYRIPDVCVVRSSDPADPIVMVPPLLCVEILSKDDSLRSLRARVEDYLSLGVENVWAIDPWKRRGYVASAQGYDEPVDGVLRVEGTLIEVTLDELFAQMDEA